MAAVEQPQLHQLVGLYVIDDLDPGLGVGRPPGSENVLEHPLGIGLADDRPLVLDAEPVPDLGPVGVGGHRGDAVHHGVGEAHLTLDPGGQVGVPEPGEGGERAAGPIAVALQVVAGHDGERGLAALPATAQRLSDQSERGPRDRAGRQVGEHVRVGRVELAGGVVDVVPALGDGQRDDPGRWRRHLLDDRLRVVRCEQVLHDRPDDPRFPGPVAVLEDQRVQAVLGVKDLLHPLVRRHDPDAADAPVERGALVHQAVVVHRLVGAMEPAHSDVDDTRRDQAAVVGRQRHPVAPVLQRPRVERLRFHRQGGLRSRGGRRRRLLAGRGT